MLQKKIRNNFMTFNKTFYKIFYKTFNKIFYKTFNKIFNKTFNKTFNKGLKIILKINIILIFLMIII